MINLFTNHHLHPAQAGERAHAGRHEFAQIAPDSPTMWNVVRCRECWAPGTLGDLDGGRPNGPSLTHPG